MARDAVIALEDAQARLMAIATLMPVEIEPLVDATGRWAARDVLAKRTQPSRNLSAMDGYAITREGFPGPWHVIGESAAGSPYSGAIGTHETVRIFTGAALPDGADCVLIQENVCREGDMITIAPALTPHPAQHVRWLGSDFAERDILIAAGTRITPARAAIAAAGGHATLAVRRCPTVAIVSTGDELVPVGADAGPDRLPSSNGIMLAAMLKTLPCVVIDAGIIEDNLTALQSAFTGITADIIVVTGGASVGDHDLVRPALIAAGADIDFWKVAVRPGKPLMAGTLGKTVVLGLPGNPASAFVTAMLFLKPLICAVGGANDPLPPRRYAMLDGALPGTGNRTDHLRAVERAGTIIAVGPNDSGSLSGLAAANALIIRNPGSLPASAGDKIEYIDVA